MTTQQVLTADVGGTSTRFALISSKYSIEDFKSFENQDSPSFDQLLQHYLHTTPALHPHTPLVIAVAGVVRNQHVDMTNVRWSLDAKDLEQKFPFPSVTLLNDLQAAAYGTLALAPESLIPLYTPPIPPDPHATRAVVSAGTGLGQACLIYHNQSWTAYASEGGHTDFPATNHLEWELVAALQEDLSHVSIEQVISGPGLLRIYHFLHQRKGGKLAQTLQGSFPLHEGGARVTQGAIDEGDPLCQMALDLFVSAYVRECGNFALKTLATGGVFIGGGIAPYLKSYLLEPDRLEPFFHKFPMDTLMQTIPLYLIEDSKAPLYGAAYFKNQT